MGQAIVIYASRSGETRDMAQAIANGAGLQGVEAVTRNAADMASAAGLDEYLGIALGSPVYGEDMLPEMRYLLSEMASMDLRGKVGAAFGSYEWNTDVPRYICLVLREQCGMEVLEPPLALKSPFLGDKEKQAREFGKALARKLQGLSV